MQEIARHTTLSLVPMPKDCIEQCNYAAAVMWVEAWGSLQTSLPEARRSLRCTLFSCHVRMRLMVVYKSRWPIGQVVYIYNPTCSLSHLDHHRQGTTLALQAFGLPPIQKKLTCGSCIIYYFVASTHIMSSLLSTLSYHHHHHSGNTYMHISIHHYYNNRSSEPFKTLLALVGHYFVWHIQVL